LCVNLHQLAVAVIAGAWICLNLLELEL